MLFVAGGIDERGGWDQVLVVGEPEADEILGGKDQVSVEFVFDDKEEIGWGEGLEIAEADNAGDGGGIAGDRIGTGVLAGVDHRSTNEFEDTGDEMLVPDTSGGCDTIGLLGFPRVSPRLAVDLRPNSDWSFVT